MSENKEDLLFTKEIKQKILREIINGNFVNVACSLAGVQNTLYEEWIRLGKKDRLNNIESEYSKFLSEIELAEAMLENYFVKNWYDLAPNSWTACKTFLEKRFKNRWGKITPSKEENVDNENIVLWKKINEKIEKAQNQYNFLE